MARQPRQPTIKVTTTEAHLPGVPSPNSKALARQIKTTGGTQTQGGKAIAPGVHPFAAAYHAAALAAPKSAANPWGVSPGVEAAAAPVETGAVDDSSPTPFDAGLEQQKAGLLKHHEIFTAQTRAQQLVTRSRYGADVNGRLNFANPTDPYSRTAELRRQYEGAAAQSTASDWGHGIGRDGAAAAHDYVLARNYGGAKQHLQEEFTGMDTGYENAIAADDPTTNGSIDALLGEAVQRFARGG